ncbi:SpoIIE family protein phosphatase [uncultured Pseudodesulfovibrio sp.]|uniref:SpoIIE family protein phosphatase n=1 Tax=uncultured Pseudodesulfovibrio sp. TaxID=2035858 RepID=UPI003748B437
MSISLVPLLVVRTSVRRDLTRMSESLAERSGNILVHKASTGLERIVEDHARVLRRERQLLESTALLLASRIEGVLSGHSHVPMPADFIPPEVPLEELNKEYYRLRKDNRQQPLDVDFARTALRGEVSDSPLGRMGPLLADVKFRYPELILWVLVDMKDGARAVYPGVDEPPRGMWEMKRAHMARQLRDTLAWTQPRVDRETKRMAFEVIAPIRDAHGTLQGNLTLVVPVDAMLHENPHVSMFSDQAESLLVSSDVDAATKATRVKVVASQREKVTGHGHWWVREDTWLTSEDGVQFEGMAERLEARKAGVVGMPYKGNSALWAFAPIDDKGTALLLIVPESDIVKDARAAKEYIEAQVSKHNRSMGYVVVLVAVSVLVLSMLLSKLFTRNITALAGAVRSVAKGNFAVRTTIRSTDEVGQLGMAFNRMIPELKERVSLKNSLEVAQEVQQNLLPSEPPACSWADVAATSSYCDETGGDYYGFIPRSTPSGDGLVVAVGDVSGHGMQAALLMASVRAYLRCQLVGGAELDRAMTTVNGLVSDDVDETGRFMTLFLLELIDGGAKWVRAGHDPAILYDAEADTFEELQGDGLPLGVTHDVAFEVGSREGLKSGDIIVIGTDGIWEMQSETGEMFGKERLKDIIRQGAGDTSDQLIQRVVADLKAFRGNAAQLDDMTIAVVKIV